MKGIFMAAMKTRVYLVLDDSGSISGAGIQKDVRDAFNRTLKDISDNAIESGDDVKVSFSLFGEDITEEYFNVPAKHLRELVKYDPNQRQTKLFEATATAIKRMADIERTDGDDCAFLLMVVTDGEENSFQYSAERLKREMAEVQKTGRYTLVFMLPPRSKATFCRQFHIPEGNVAEWEQSRKGVQKAQDVQSQGVANYFKARRAGQMSTGSFYPDMSRVTSADLRANLVDIARDCNVWDVMKKERIDTFCARMSGKAYIKGAAFYQLVKTEKVVQDYKGIIIMEKGKSQIYAGDAARDLLGLPGHNVKLIPGNHANYLIFVQSTSLNRNLDPGTKIVYYPPAAL
jgi:hypothetical protein